MGKNKKKIEFFCENEHKSKLLKEIQDLIKKEKIGNYFFNNVSLKTFFIKTNLKFVSYKFLKITNNLSLNKTIYNFFKKVDIKKNNEKINLFFKKNYKSILKKCRKKKFIYVSYFNFFYKNINLVVITH